MVERVSGMGVRLEDMAVQTLALIYDDTDLDGGEGDGGGGDREEVELHSLVTLLVDEEWRRGNGGETTAYLVIT